jgi:hypothetical protein
VNGSSLYADVPGFKSPSIITGDAYRPDLLLSLSNGSLYVVELTVGYETNLENNVKRKKAKYRELVRQLDENFNEVNFVNLSMSSLGIFAQECSTFLEMLGNVGLDKNPKNPSPPENARPQIKFNKTLYGALTRWVYTNTRITVHDHTCRTYSTQLSQLRFKVFPQLSGKVENERERHNTVTKMR